MLKIRLKRCGRKKSPTYRIVLMPSQSKRDGRVIEELGYYNPFTKMIKFDREKIMHHIKNGAQLTPTVKNFLNK